MPRDINGNYTLPAGNPVVSGTVIETAWANPTMGDIAIALTDSLSRTGQGGMLVAFKNADGTVASPGITWTNQPTAGFYRNAVSDFRYAIGGSDVFIINAGGIEIPSGKTASGAFSGTFSFSSQMLAPDGVIGAPGISWTNEPAAGFYRLSAGVFQYVIGGAAVIGITSTILSTGVGVGLSITGNAAFASNMTVSGQIVGGGFMSTEATTALTYPSNAGFSLSNSGLIAFAASAASNWPASTELQIRHSNGTIVPVQRWVHDSSSLGFHYFLRNIGAHGAQADMAWLMSGPFSGAAAGSSGSLGVALSPHVPSVASGGKLEWIYSVTGASPTTSFQMSIARGGTIDAFNMQLLMNTFNLAQMRIGGSMTATLSSVNRAGLWIDGTTFGVNASICFDSVSSNDCMIMEHAGTLYTGYEGGPGPIGGWSETISQAGAHSAGSYTPVSDRDGKFDIRPINNVLADVLRLKGVRFKYKHTGEESMGLIAQDVSPIFPELVGHVPVPPMDGNPGFNLLTLNYNALTGALVEAIRELEQRVKLLEA